MIFARKSTAAYIVDGSSLRSPPPVPRRIIKPVVDSDLANLYLAQFKQLQKELALPGEITIETILRSPGVISVF